MKRKYNPIAVIHHVIATKQEKRKLEGEE